jgi:hypothetical protein
MEECVSVRRHVKEIAKNFVVNDLWFSTVLPSTSAHLILTQTEKMKVYGEYYRYGRFPTEQIMYWRKDAGEYI